MSNWVKVETRFPSHPKVLDIGPLGEALWLRGLCYAGEQLTDGFIPASYIKRMSDMKAVTVAARLVCAGLWEEAEGGYLIHDFLDWQRSRDEVDDVSSKRAEAGRKGGKQKASNALANVYQNASNLLETVSSKTLADKNRVDKNREELTPPLSPDGGNSPDEKPKRKSRLPDGWTPSDQQRAVLADQGFSTAEIDTELVKFRNYHLNKGDTGLAWDRAFANWMDNSRTFAKPRAPANGRGIYPFTREEELAAIAANPLLRVVGND